MLPNTSKDGSISPRTYQLLSWSAFVGAATAVIGLVFIFIFYSGVFIFGPLNDIAYTLQLLSTLPIILFLSQRFESGSLFTRRFVRWGGLASCLIAISLQLLLIAGVLSFFSMIGPLLASIAVLTTWFVVLERSGHENTLVPKGWLLAVLAGLTFGYPIWAFRFQSNLKRLHGEHSVAVEGAVQ